MTTSIRDSDGVDGENESIGLVDEVHTCVYVCVCV